MRNLIIAATLVGLSTAGWAQQPKPDPQPEKPDQKKPQDKQPEAPKSKDETFASEAARINLHEVAMGRLTNTNSTNPEVKAFGERMVNDHQQLNDELRKLAEKKNIKLPDALEENVQKELDGLAKLQGATFDKRFMEHMVHGHEQAVAKFKKASAEVQDAEIKQFAVNTLPKLETHLKDAKKLKDTLNGGNNPPKPDKPAPPEPREPKDPKKPAPDQPKPASPPPGRP